MGSIYARGSKLWLAYVDTDGKRKLVSSGLAVGREDEAHELLEALEAKLAAERAAGVTPDSGPLTLTRYAERWLKQRSTSGITSDVDEHGRITNHVLPTLGSLPLTEIRPRHVRDLVRELRHKTSARGTPLAPKTVISTYRVLRRMLQDAEIDELIKVNPCKLKHGDLPAKVDADPEWRATAVFTRGEVKAVISDELIPEDRRVFYAIMFLGGLRFGEVSALRWRAYDATLQPLGRLDVVKSYSTRKKREKGTKTHRARQIPVHRTLAAILGEWKLGGFQRMVDHAPQTDDLIVPSREGQNRSSNHMLNRFHEDLERIGLRSRRQHDARRTLMSLGLGDGARRDILKWIVHGSSGDISDQYTTLPWPALCEAISCLQISRRTGDVIAMPMATAVGSDCYSAATVDPPKRKTPEDSASSGVLLGRGGRDLNGKWHSPGLDTNRPELRNNSHLRILIGPDAPGRDADCATVPFGAIDVSVTQALDAARSAWSRSRDRAELRAALLALLVTLK